MPSPPLPAVHSKRVALFADLIAEELGLSDEHRRHLKRAGLLHDIGKLGVSNKSSTRTASRMTTKGGDPKPSGPGRTILSRITAFSDLAVVAASHHERLDGRGYPHGLTAEALGLDTRNHLRCRRLRALTARPPLTDRPCRSTRPFDHGTGMSAWPSIPTATRR